MNDNLARWGLFCLSGPWMNRSRDMCIGKVTLVTSNDRGKWQIHVPQTAVFIRWLFSLWGLSLIYPTLGTSNVFRYLRNIICWGKDVECPYQGYAAFAFGTHSNIFREKREKNITAMKAWFLQHGTSENKKDSQKIWERKLKTQWEA